MLGVAFSLGRNQAFNKAATRFKHHGFHNYWCFKTLICRVSYITVRVTLCSALYFYLINLWSAQIFSFNLIKKKKVTNIPEFHLAVIPTLQIEITLHILHLGYVLAICAMLSVNSAHVTDPSPCLQWRRECMSDKNTFIKPARSHPCNVFPSYYSTKCALCWGCQDNHRPLTLGPSGV